MKTFVEVVREIKKSFDQDDVSILAAIEDSYEADLTAASIRHLAGTFFVYNKKVYKAIQLIPVGDPIVIGTAGTPGVNAVLAEDIMSLIAGIGDSKFGDFVAVTDVTIDGVIYHTYWKVAPTNSNQVSGLAIHPTNGQLCEIYNNQGTYSLTSFTTEIQALSNQADDMNNILGAKNLIPNNGVDSANNGITWHVNDDGSITATGQLASDKNSTYFDVYNNAIPFPTDKNYKVSGLPTSMTLGDYKIQVFDDVDYGTYPLLVEEGETLYHPSANVTSIIYRIRIYTHDDLGTGGVTFYPMIRPASIEDDTYVPYAMTNRELTEQISSLIKIKKYTYHYTANADSETHFNPVTVVNADPISGYNPIAIVGYATNNIDVFPFNVNFYNISYGVGLKNTRKTASADNDFDFYVLFIKSNVV